MNTYIKTIFKHTSVLLINASSFQCLKVKPLLITSLINKSHAYRKYKSEQKTPNSLENKTLLCQFEKSRMLSSNHYSQCCTKMTQQKRLMYKVHEEIHPELQCLILRLIFHPPKSSSTGEGSSSFKLTCNILLKELQINAMNPFH